MKEKKPGIKFSPERFNYALDAAGTTQKQLAEKYAEEYQMTVKAAEVFFVRCKNRRYISSMSSLSIISQLLDVAPGYLTGETNILFSDLTRNEKDILEEYFVSASRREDPQGFFIPSYSLGSYFSKMSDYKEAVYHLIALQALEDLPDKNSIDITDLKKEDISDLVYEIRKLISKWLYE